MMQEEIRSFMEYLRSVKNAAANTMISYERDLRKMQGYMNGQGITSVSKVTSTALNAYVLYLESSGMSSATISRTIAALRRFFDYQCKHGSCTQDPSELLRAPKVEKKATRVVTKEELQQILDLRIYGPKQLRDRAMVLAMCQGIRASEVISLSLSDVNLKLGYLILQGERQSRTVPIGSMLAEALQKYMEDGRSHLIRENSGDALFVNCSGSRLSRQGVWKVVKYYGEQVGIPELTPDGLRLPAEDRETAAVAYGMR